MKRKLGRGKERGLLRRDESGQILVLVVFAAVFLIGMAALAVDIGHGLVVRNELQNAADASSLAGAGNLFIPSPGPNWARAEGAASGSIAWNKSDGQSLVNGQVQSGVWNLSQSPAGLQSQGTPLNAQNVPAVRVQVGRAPGQNGGSVPTFFARIFGMNSFPVQAQAVAVVSNPGFVPPGTGMMPMAINSAMAANFNSYKDAQHTFKIMSTYGAPPAQAGQFTSLLVDFNDVNRLRNLITTLITTGTPNQINIGSIIYIQPGVEANIFDHASQPDLKLFEGKDLFLPVVSGSLGAPGGPREVVGFVGFHVLLSTKSGNTGNVEGWFTTGLIVPNSGGSGPNYGAWTPPHLVL